LSSQRFFDFRAPRAAFPFAACFAPPRAGGALFRPPRAAPRFAADLRAGAALAFPAAPFRAAETTRLTPLVATLTCRFAAVTVRRTVRRTARLGAAVASTALDAISVAVLLAAFALLAALPAALFAASAAPWAASATAFVALPSALPTTSADLVSGSGAELV